MNITYALLLEINRIKLLADGVGLYRFVPGEFPLLLAT